MKKRLIRARRDRGFTLAELMVVIVILGLLATLVVRNVIPSLLYAKTETAKIQVAALEAAVEEFQIRNSGRLPESLDLLVQPDENGLTYLKNATSVPLDPWGNQYFYHPDPNGVSFEVGTYGRDGQQGGEGDAADITNKTLANEASKKKTG